MNSYMEAGYPAGKCMGNTIFATLVMFNFLMVVFPFVAAGKSLSNFVSALKEIAGNW